MDATGHGEGGDGQKGNTTVKMSQDGQTFNKASKKITQMPKR